ncbi:hypothetical protein SADUNF_Sadunf06G0037800 [Salix dunnii]|uniref:Transmembrane protein 230 n=1 Tax=Salix dunnii TaxID=1413687 RepID=A0A835K5B4_9ROSI|nr:hypothetical protein SADUNF_Sadunf06G0037800 [Salix dunnii]
MASRRNVRYSALPDDDNDDKFGVRYDPRFDYTPGSFDSVPWKSIFLAIFLLFLGCVLLFLSFFIFTGHMGGEKAQAYGLLALGIITFMPVNCFCRTKEGMVSQRFLAFPEAYQTLNKFPLALMYECFSLDGWMDGDAIGFYECRIAYYSWRGAKGYQFASIPRY